MPVLGIDASRAVKKEKTGVEWYGYYLLRAMEKITPSDWQVRLYIPDESGIWNHELKRWSWKVLRWIGKGWTQGRLSLEMIKSPPDVLFVPSHVIPLVHPENTVTTVHDVVFLSRPELYDPKDLENQKRGLDFALKFAKKIIVPTRAVREDLSRVGAKSDQIVVVPHGVEIATPRLDVEARNDIGGPYLLFIGRIEKKKNVMGLIHALRHLQGNTKLILAGSLGYGGQDVLQAIKTFKLEKKVIHLGWIEREQYFELLRSAALLVLPSFGEGFGLPVLEAMAAGVPVACSDIPVLREIGGNAVQYFNPNDPQDIARVIEGVLKNEMLRSEMARAGKERAREYSWEKTAKETWEVIEEAVSM